LLRTVVGVFTNRKIGDILFGFQVMSLRMTPSITAKAAVLT